MANNEDICKKVANGLTLDIPEHCPKILKNVMTLSWKYAPFERCSFEDIVSIIVEAKPNDDISYAAIHLPEQPCETLLTSSGIGSEDLEITMEQTAKSKNSKYVLPHLHEHSSKKQKICLLAIVLLVLTVICLGIGVPLSYYNGKSWTSAYDLVLVSIETVLLPLKYPLILFKKKKSIVLEKASYFLYRGLLSKPNHQEW